MNAAVANFVKQCMSQKGKNENYEVEKYAIIYYSLTIVHYCQYILLLHIAQCLCANIVFVILLLSFIMVTANVGSEPESVSFSCHLI